MSKEKLRIVERDTLMVELFCAVVLVGGIVIGGDRLVDLWAVPTWVEVTLSVIGAVLALFVLLSDS